MDTDKWLTLPDDLLVEIFRRLDVFSAVIRCAAACRPWRRTIINNASYLRLRPNCFLPDLLLGFLANPPRQHLPHKLQYFPVVSNSTVPSPFLVPATGVCVDGREYSTLVSSRDGFLLLGEDNGVSEFERLCLCNAHTGVSRVLPAAEFGGKYSKKRTAYFMVTGYDVVLDNSTSDDGGGDETAVWILAVYWTGTETTATRRPPRPRGKDGMTYRIFSSTTAAWGPVKRSAKIPEDVALALNLTCPSSLAVVVYRGAVSWFICLMTCGSNRAPTSCIFSLDLRTGRTWTTEVPPDLVDFKESSSSVLAVSEDGRLSLVNMLSTAYSDQIEVWVLVGDHWTLRWTIDGVQMQLPSCPRLGEMMLSGFCPRSGYLFGSGRGHRNNVEYHFIIGVDGSSPRLIGRLQSDSSTSPYDEMDDYPHPYEMDPHPYEMDSSTYISSYISKMKYF